MKKQINKALYKLTVITPEGYTMQDRTEYNGCGKINFQKNEFTFLMPEVHEASHMNGTKVKNPILFQAAHMRFRMQPGQYERGTIVLDKELNLDSVEVRKALIQDFSNALKSIAARRRM